MVQALIIWAGGRPTPLDFGSGQMVSGVERRWEKRKNNRWENVRGEGLEALQPKGRAGPSWGVHCRNPDLPAPPRTTKGLPALREGELEPVPVCLCLRIQNNYVQQIEQSSFKFPLNEKIFSLISLVGPLALDPSSFICSFIHSFLHPTTIAPASPTVG